MALALALNAKIRWRTGFRTIFFLPMVLSGLIVSYIFTFIIGTSIPIIAGAIHFAPLESSLLANQHFAWVESSSSRPGWPFPARSSSTSRVSSPSRRGLRGRLDRRRDRGGSSSGR